MHNAVKVNCNTRFRFQMVALFKIKQVKRASIVLTNHGRRSMRKEVACALAAEKRNAYQMLAEYSL